MWEPNCGETFADGFGCPYDPLDGYGSVDALDSGTATGGDATHLYRTGYDFASAGLSAGHTVIAKSGATYTAGIVQSVNSRPLTVDSWRNGTPGSGWTYEAGPKFTDCTYTVEGCSARGLFADVNTFNQVQRRFFSGWARPRGEVKERIRSRLVGTFKRGDETSFPTPNLSVIGKPIPIPVGEFLLREIEPIAWLRAGRTDDDNGQFYHFIFPIGEGRCSQLHATSSLRVSGRPMDNYDPHAPIGAVDDPLILYGFENLYAFNGAKGNDSAAVVSGELTEEQQKACVGARESLAWSWNQALDTYQHNPLVFNDSLGNGISWSRRSIVRIRIQTKDLDPEQARLTVRGVGTMMERVGMAGWTPGPNVVEVAYNAFVRKGWGKGVDPARMDADSWAAASNYCAYEKALRQTTFTALSGTVAFGPLDGPAPSRANGLSWVFVTTSQTPAQYVGGTLRVFAGGTWLTRKIVDTLAVREKSGDSTDLDPSIGGGESSDNTGGEYVTTGAYLFVDQTWETGYVPAKLAQYEVIRTVTSTEPRYVAGGVLNVEEKKFGEAINEILGCCNGEAFEYLGKIYCAIRKQEDLAVVNARETITDKGDGRNVLIHNGVSSAKITKMARGPNEMRFRFPNIQRDYEIDTLVIRDRSAQLDPKTRFNENTKDTKKAGVFLPLLVSVEQVARLAQVKFRTEGVRSDGKPNVEFQVEMPAHLTMTMIPIEHVTRLTWTGSRRGSSTGAWKRSRRAGTRPRPSSPSRATATRTIPRMRQTCIPSGISERSWIRTGAPCGSNLSRSRKAFNRRTTAQSWRYWITS